MNKGYKLKKITVRKTLYKKQEVKNGQKLKIKNLSWGDYEIIYVDKYTNKEVKAKCSVYFWKPWAAL